VKNLLLLLLSLAAPSVVLFADDQKNLSSPTGLEMVYVVPGSFMMGSDTGKPNERPAHRVTLTRGYYISKYEVTKDIYQKVMGENPAGHKGAGLPVEQVNFRDAARFCNELSKREGRTPAYVILDRWFEWKGDAKADGYRLPTEAEWEYAARGGVKSRGFKYAGSDNAKEVAWFHGNSGGKTHPVGQKAPNELGLFDMSGNVNEWCYDFYNNYTAGPKVDPYGRVSRNGLLRGGHYNSYPADACGVTARVAQFQGIRNSSGGFRVVLPAAR